MSRTSRDRIAVVTALVGVALVAWIYLWMLAQRMSAMPGMSDMSGMDMSAAAIHPWSGSDFAMMFVMWAVMMVGMMLPTALPMTLVYAAVARKAAGQGTPVAPTAMFVAGYVSMWTLFSVAATFAQWGLDQAALLSATMVASSSWVGAVALGVAGVYQLTPAKDACLEHCRAPAQFISQHWREGAAGAFRLGAIHGAFCLGCCWALMGLLFVGGVMNLLWIAAITAFVLAEKVLPFGERSARYTGWAMMASAAWIPWRGWVA
jgi:predicted metal-binding membrane protein